MAAQGSQRGVAGFPHLTGWTRLLVVFVLALGLRIAYLIHIRDDVSFQIIALDSELFDQKALDILRTDFWGTGVFYTPPLYPYFLAFIYAIAGPSFLAVRLVQIVLSAMTASLVVRISEKYFDEPVPLLAGLLAALYTPFVFYSATILGTTLAVFLTTLGLDLFVEGERAARRRDMWILLAGSVIGFGSLLRPNTIIVVPLWVAAIGFWARPRRWVRSAALVLVGTGVVIAPVAVRNLIVGDDFVPISSHGGINFWIGNHPNAVGTFDLPPGIRGTPEQVNLIDSSQLAMRAVGRELKPSEVSSYWFAQGWGFIRQNPGEAASLFLRKTRMFWNRFEIPLNVSYHFTQQSSPLLRIPLMHFGLISPLAVLGLVLALGRRRTLLAAYSLVIVYFLSAVAFFVSARYRLPVIPVLIVFAAYALWWLFDRARRRSWRAFVPASVLFGVLAFHANIPVEGFSMERSFARDYYYLGAHYRSLNQDEQALRYYDLSLQHNPDFWLSYNGRAVCLAELGRIEEAVPVFRKAIDLEPTRAEPWTNLGIALAGHGRLAEAVPCWEKALEINPSDETARTNLWRARRILESRNSESAKRRDGEKP